MSIYFGENKITNINFNEKISTVYYGENKVYGSTTIPWYDDSEIAKLTSADIGMTKDIVINNRSYKLRLIGIDHDKLANDNHYSHTTWQLVELFSGSTGAAIVQQWKSATPNTYADADIRTYLNNTFKGYLPTDLQSAIKTVKKKTSAGNGSSTVNEWNEDIFLLSYTELSGYQKTTSTTYKNEGHIYSYWSAHTTDSDRIKKDKSGAVGAWWLRSPYISSTNKALLVGSSSMIQGFYVNDTDAVSPVFCLGVGLEMPTPIKFSEDTWDNICYNCSALEAGTIADFHFCDRYLKDDGSAITSMDDFIGLKHTFVLNEVVYNAVIIGVNHDILASDSTKRAVLTFQVEEVITDKSTGNPVLTQFSTGTSKYYNDSDLKVYIDNLINTLSTSIDIKYVKKECWTSAELTTLNLRGFPLSVKEMAREFSQSPIEGTAYAYWTNHNNDSERIKYPVDSSTAQYWWLRSPATSDYNLGDFTVDTNGRIYITYPTYTNGISFAFCI